MMIAKTQDRRHPAPARGLRGARPRISSPVHTAFRSGETRSKKPRTAPIATPKYAHVRIVPLGGLEEVGRNMMYLEYVDPKSANHGDIVVIDMGLQFPEDNMPGIDYIVPNIESLLPKREHIKGVVITHAHYDHIGAIPHLMPELGRNVPLYATDLTLAIIEKRQEDFHPPHSLNLNKISSDTVLKLGAFELSFFGVSHNVPASVGVVLRTPIGRFVHTGDFKLDVRSDIAGKLELEKIKELGRAGDIRVLMSDSTNARETGHQFSETDIQIEMEAIIKNAKGRLIIGTFASLLGRLNEIIQLAERHKKKVVIEGRSMRNNIEIARRLGYMKFDEKNIIRAEESSKYLPEKIIVLATGAQGEDRAALMRIANRQHRSLQIQPGDTVVFSSSVIPGNERSVQLLTDKLYREGAEVINYRMLDIHAGGHAKQEDLKLMIELVKPQFLMPIEGNHSFLKMHAKVGLRAGLKPEQIIIADNGQVVEASREQVALTKEYVPSSYVMVDGLGVGDVKEVVLRDRKMLSEDGIFVAIVIVDSETLKVRNSPDIISRGFVYLRESKELLQQARGIIRKAVEETAGKMSPVNWTYVKDMLRERLGEFLFSKTQRRPMVLPVIIEV
ncbi:MAG: ribonuclease J [Parcubacteria group bacterium]|nr:ribonuclease J [Parcubacteria group bacterium]